MSNSSNKRAILYLALALVVILAVGLVASTGASNPELATVLSIDPALAEVPVGASVTVDIVVSDVLDLYGISLALTFDPAIVEVDGAVLTPGTCPAPDFVVQNTADNTLGTINYDAASLLPSPPCDGTGIVASITFNKIAAGTSPVHLDTWLLSDTDGIEILATATDGSITDPTGPPTLLWLDPPAPSVSGGGSLDLRLDDVTNVFGAQVDLTYDPAVLSIPSGDVTPGVCPQPDFVVVNTAAGGAISYAATQFNPTPPCNGGVVATIDFLCDPGLVADTPTDVIITSSLISDPDGTAITHSLQDATVTCLASSFDVEGTVGLQAWSSPEGVLVTLYDDTEGVLRDQVIVGPDGSFSLSGKIDNLHTLTASYPRYLDLALSGITSPTPGDVVNVGHGTLPSGDVNGDGVINILDLSVVAGHFTKTSPQPWAP
jgi:hypothetical protein